MRLLVLAGTAWLGHEIARTAVAAGHDVTCVARGTDVPAGAGLLRADRDDPSALAVLADRRWDAVVDVARQPGHVRRAARTLEPVASRYVFVSSANVYASHAELGADERSERLLPLGADAMSGPDDYGAAKVACEDAVLDAFGGERCVIVRAGLIGGPGDPTGRTDYWPWRLANPSTPDGVVLAPDALSLPTAVIDVRDLADWLVRGAQGEASGVFNANGTPTPLPAHLDIAGSLTRRGSEIVTASDGWLLAHDVQEWAGPRSLPLWLTARDWYGLPARSNAKALDNGLALRPLEQTLADALAWRQAQPSDYWPDAGLRDDDERTLLALLRD